MTIESQRIGRIARIDDDSLELVSDGRRTTLQSPPDWRTLPLQPGDLVILRVSRELPLAVEEVVEVHPWTGTGSFPPPGSDWERMNRGPENLMNALLGRARLLRAIRGMFDSRGFIEVDTPTMASCAALEPHLESVKAELRITPGGETITRWMITSPEYHMKRLLSSGASRIYQIGKAYRSRERGQHHNPEFTMLEWYRTFSNVEEGIGDTVDVICAAAQAIHGTHHIPFQGEQIDLTPPWPRWTVREAIQKWGGFDPDPSLSVEALRARAQTAGISLDSEDVNRSDILIRTLVEKVETAIPRNRPVILHEYPQCLASLARPTPHDPTIAERFEVYVGGMELANGFGELVDAQEQRRRFEAEQMERRRRGLPEHAIDERLIAALEVGVPPSTGIALGIDRLLMLVLNHASIANVVSFPSEET